jgi:hypothetical protein
MIGQKLSPVLVEIEDTLWEFEYHNASKPNYSIDGFRAATKIFMSVMMDKIWELQSNEKMDMDDRIKMVETVGRELRDFVKKYTDIDTVELYK